MPTCNISCCNVDAVRRKQKRWVNKKIIVEESMRKQWMLNTRFEFLCTSRRLNSVLNFPFKYTACRMQRRSDSTVFWVASFQSCQVRCPNFDFRGRSAAKQSRYCRCCVNQTLFLQWLHEEVCYGRQADRLFSLHLLQKKGKADNKHTNWKPGTMKDCLSEKTICSIWQICCNFNNLTKKGEKTCSSQWT